MSNLLEKCLAKKEKLLSDRKYFEAEIEVINKNIKLIDELIGNTDSFHSRKYQFRRKSGIRSDGWKTNKTYREISYEIIHSDPNNWWSTLDITKAAIELGYFDVNIMPVHKIHSGFYATLIQYKRLSLTKKHFHYKIFDRGGGKTTHYLKAIISNSEDGSVLMMT
jgi:hypothetical protein